MHSAPLFVFADVLKKKRIEDPVFCAARMAAYYARQPSGVKVMPPFPANEVVWLQMYQTPKLPTETVTSPSEFMPR